MVNRPADRPLFFLRYSAPEPSRVSHTPHSHSIVLRHGNALNSWRKFFPRAPKHRSLDPSKNRALDFNGEFRRSAICWVSRTIDIDRSISAARRENAPCSRLQRKDRQQSTPGRRSGVAVECPMRSRGRWHRFEAEVCSLQMLGFWTRGPRRRDGSGRCICRHVPIELPPPSLKDRSSWLRGRRGGNAGHELKLSAAFAVRAELCPLEGFE
jgi:hypothetical protein